MSDLSTTLSKVSFRLTGGGGGGVEDGRRSDEAGFNLRLFSPILKRF